MKHLFFSLIIGLTLFFVVPVAAAPNIGFENGGLAQKIGGGAGYDTSSGETGLSTTVGKIIRVMLSLSGTAFLALTVYGGIRWMLARGDEGEIGASKEIIKAAIIGLAISLSAYALTSFVVSKITSSTGADQVGGGAPRTPTVVGDSGKAVQSGNACNGDVPIICPGQCIKAVDFANDKTGKIGCAMGNGSCPSGEVCVK